MNFDYDTFSLSLMFRFRADSLTASMAQPMAEAQVIFYVTSSRRLLAYLLALSIIALLLGRLVSAPRYV